MTISHRYLLDTNILSLLLRDPQGAIYRRISRHGEQSICTSIIVAAELRYGAEKSASDRLVERVSLILSSIEVLPFEAPADSEYARLRNYLARRGTPIGPNDLLIAAQALAEGVTLVTANTGEFLRVPRLQVENWAAL